MIDPGLLNGPVADVNVRPFQRKMTQVSRPVSRSNYPWILSPKLDAFLHDRFSTRLEDTDTGRRIR